MMRALKLAGAAATLGLIGYAAVVLFADRTAQRTAIEAVEDAADQADEAVLNRDREELAARFRRAQLARTGLFDHDEPLPDSIEFGNGSISHDDARFGFEHVVSRLEELGRERRRLSRAEWDEAYRTANDAFSALSAGLDGRTPAEADELEAAHQRLQRALRGVRVRGGHKFGR